MWPIQELADLGEGISRGAGQIDRQQIATTLVEVVGHLEVVAPVDLGQNIGVEPPEVIQLAMHPFAEPPGAPVEPVEPFAEQPLHRLQPVAEITGGEDELRSGEPRIQAPVQKGDGVVGEGLVPVENLRIGVAEERDRRRRRGDSEDFEGGVQRGRSRS